MTQCNVFYLIIAAYLIFNIEMATEFDFFMLQKLISIITNSIENKQQMIIFNH